MVCTPCRADTVKRKPPIYKVLLHNDNFNRREYVVKVLLKIVEGMTVDDAVNVMQVRQPLCPRS
jgi:ATP-dependent Clp protease adaptor protein ClpS